MGGEKREETVGGGGRREGRGEKGKG